MQANRSAIAAQCMQDNEKPCTGRCRPQEHQWGVRPTPRPYHIGNRVGGDPVEVSSVCDMRDHEPGHE